MDGCWFTMDLRCWEQHCYGAYRAFIADTLDEEQQPVISSSKFFYRFRSVLAYISIGIFPLIIVGYTGELPNWMPLSSSILSITSIWWSMSKTTEIPPTAEEIEYIKANPLNIISFCRYL
jgi:maltose/moltooligosaccharide transporter